MKIYSVDAASIISGYALLESTSGGVTLLEAGTHKFDPKWAITARLAGLFEGVRAHLEQYTPDAIVVEKIMFTGRNMYLQSLGITCKAVGAVEAAFGSHGQGAYHTYTATQVRSLCPAKPARPAKLESKTTTKKKKSKPKRKTKADLRKLVNRHFKDDLIRLGYPKGLEKKHEDISDAIGLAFYTSIQLKTEQRTLHHDHS